MWWLFCQEKLTHLTGTNNVNFTLVSSGPTLVQHVKHDGSTGRVSRFRSPGVRCSTKSATSYGYPPLTQTRRKNDRLSHTTDCYGSYTTSDSAHMISDNYCRMPITGGRATIAYTSGTSPSSAHESRKVRDCPTSLIFNDKPHFSQDSYQADSSHFNPEVVRDEYTPGTQLSNNYSQSNRGTYPQSFSSDANSYTSCDPATNSLCITNSSHMKSRKCPQLPAAGQLWIRVDLNDLASDAVQVQSESKPGRIDWCEPVSFGNLVQGKASHHFSEKALRRGLVTTELLLYAASKMALARYLYGRHRDEHLSLDFHSTFICDLANSAWRHFLCYFETTPHHVHFF